MRGMFGLLSLLICVALVAYLWSTHTSAISKPAVDAREQATQLSGHDTDGKSAMETIKTEPEMVNGHFKSLIVTELTPGGAMEKFYGFKKGDKITSEGVYDVTTNDSADTAKAMLLDAFEKFQSVEVIRDGEPMKLPVGGAGKTAQDKFNQLQNIGAQ